MKIAVIGSYDSKKKEVCSSLISYFENKGISKDKIGYYDVISAIDRKLKEQIENLKKSVDEEKLEKVKQDVIFQVQESTELFAKLAEWNGEFKHIILNKSLFDVYAYTELKFSDYAKEFFYSELTSWTSRHPYNALLKVPILNNSKDTEKRDKLDKRLEEILKELKTPCLELKESFFNQPNTIRFMIFEEYFGKLMK